MTGQRRDVLEIAENICPEDISLTQQGFATKIFQLNINYLMLED
jgi:hypothetical protein